MRANVAMPMRSAWPFEDERCSEPQRRVTRVFTDPIPSLPKGRHIMKKSKGSSHHPAPPQHHHAPELIIDPPHHLAPMVSDSHHAQLQRHAAQKTHALMSNVMAQARGSSDIGPRLVLQPHVINEVLIGPTDEVGIGIDLVAAGVVVQVEAWTPMAVGDLLEVFWGTYPGTASVSKQLTTPDELNKPVLLPVPAAIINAGWVSVVARVTRFGSGFLDVSPALPLLVKLDPPGAISPPPTPENTNLIAPVLPPEVLANGVDATWAASGVPVTIEPYPNMDEGDRLRLNWGGAYIERTVVKADVGNPVTLTVDDATIRSVGDSDALQVRYQVFDLVNNRSGWSPTVSIEVHVIVGGLYPPEVNHTDADGVIDLDLLGSDDVSVFVTAFTPVFNVGDEITLNWIGHTSTGAQVPYTAKLTFTNSPIQTLQFLIPNATVTALAGGDAVVFYSLPDGRTSTQVPVTIVGEAATLPTPKVDEAPSGQLDASLSSATVRIPANPIFAPGDVITLIWSGTRADGSALRYQTTRNVTGGMIGNDILIPVPGSEIAPLTGGTLQVSYTVQHGDGTTLPASGVLMLMVGTGAGLLLPPTVDEAPDNATLDPDTVTLQATVTIQPYDGMDVGDRIDMYWVGSSGDSYHDWTTVSTVTKGKAITFPVDKDPYVIDNDGGTVTVSYTVTKGTDVRNSTPLSLRVGKAEIPIPGDLAVPVVTEADPFTGTLNLVKPVNGVHVVIDYDGMANGDTVTMYWQGASGDGTQQQSATVSEIGAIIFAVDDTAIAPNYNRTVAIFYTVTRKGAPDESAVQSEPLNLAVQNPSLVGIMRFSTGTTSYFRCTVQSTVTIRDDLAVNSVILTSPTVQVSAWARTTLDDRWSIYHINLVGSEPRNNSPLFPTGVPGIAFKAYLNDEARTPGPITGTDAADNLNGRAFIQFIKVGPIKDGTRITSGDYLQQVIGSNRLIFLVLQLVNNVTINVVTN
jgi:hypothetical protein